MAIVFIEDILGDIGDIFENVEDKDFYYYISLAVFGLPTFIHSLINVYIGSQVLSILYDPFGYYAENITGMGVISFITGVTNMLSSKVFLAIFIVYMIYMDIPEETILTT